MIFLSVGTHNEPFDRLLKEMDKIIESGKISDKVIAQIGNSIYRPRRYQFFKFTSWQRILKFNRSADVIVTHGGAGNLILASHFNKIIVAVPRMKKFGEHVNDHQLQLVKELERQGRVIAVYDISRLEDAIMNAKGLRIRNKNYRKERKIISIVRDYVQKVAVQNHKEA